MQAINIEGQTFETASFEELLKHGQDTTVQAAGWSFQWHGLPVTHESDECYLVKSADGLQSLSVRPGDVLIKDPEGKLFTVSEGYFQHFFQIVADIARSQLNKIIETLTTLATRPRAICDNEDEAKKIASHRHYKGGYYLKLYDGLHTETQEILTTYLHVWPNKPGLYHRPKDMFDGTLENGQLRFTPLHAA